MGVPKFFRYISERYPCILEMIKENQTPEFDNLYLDMNGILHASSHSDEQDISQTMSEEEIFNNIFHYLDILFSIIRPKKLIFMAVDGVAPRAKLNQQRSRRFRVAKEREVQENKLLSEGHQLPEDRFDSNCITPGTDFMLKVQSQLEYYITSRITSNPLWQKCKVILSGHEVPGEGEHKIMEYIRYLKGMPDYDPNLRHCLYGLDADLVMLGLSVHERHVSILREEVIFGRKAKSIPPGQTKFCLLHLCLLKEYLDLEFQDIKESLPFEFDLENIVDDWVLMSFILGNDFIPHLPDFHIAKGALPVLFKVYSDVLPTLGGYLNEEGHLNLQRFQIFMEALAKYELKAFEETYADLQHFAEKTEKRLNSEKDKENDKPKDPELEKLTRAVDEEFDFSDEELEDNGSDAEGDSDDDDDDEGTFFQEFRQHKRDYYMNKLEYSEVTDEFLQSQAEGYVRGLQWILHYYYHGCPSWSWFYPHHYAPCTSDVVNFKNVNLDFDLGKPFLPYQQLLAVLPPSSKDLVPKAYRKLMTSPDSPLKEYYPNHFETDLNGKQASWEAVVLLPIINEDNLLNAMKECDGNLTPEEIRNNKHSPMIFYSYTTENLGVYKSPKYFPNIEANHALMKTMWRDEISAVATRIKMKTVKKDLDMHFPGFPTFKFISFKATKQKAGIKIFNFASTSDSVVLTISQEEQPETEVLAAKLLDQNVFVSWPFLTEARVVAVADENYIYSLSDKVTEKREHSSAEKLKWTSDASNCTRLYAEKRGIIIGDVKVLIYAKILRGMIIAPDSAGVPSNVKVWSEGVEFYPLQTVVKDIKVYEPSISFSSFEEFFSVGSVVFTLTPMFYGAMGTIVKHMEQSSNRVRVEIEVPKEHIIDMESLNQSKSRYYNAYVAGQKIGINQSLVARLSGNIFVDTSNPGEMSEKKSTVNIGLGLKYNKYQEEIPGYTKKDNYWMYSNKAISVMNEYVKTYPQVISFLTNRPKESYVFPRREIFPDPDGAEDIQKLLQWIKSLECSKIKRVPCGSDILEKDVVLKLETFIDESPKEIFNKTIIAKTDQLFKSDLVTNSLPPVLGAEHRLLDRVISVMPNHPVPQGLRGYIIGIYTASNSHEVMYDILYDRPFPAGMSLNCSPNRGFRTSEKSFINISHGQRLHEATNTRKTNRATTSSETVNSPRVLVRESQSSAFAQWNVNPHGQTTPDKENPFKGMWALLEKDKSQDETKILKKMLKIEEDEKPKIEENVKNFFETLSRNPEKLMPSLGNPVMMPKPRQSEAQTRLLQHLHSKNLPPPKFVFSKDGKGGSNVCKVQLRNQKEFVGTPCENAGMARDSAAEVALNGLTSSHKDVDQVSQKMIGKTEGETQKILEWQAKLQKALFKDSEPSSKARNPEPVKPGVKPRGTNDKSNRGNKPVQQGQRKNNVPHVLPTPPPLWRRQFKNSNTNQHRNPSGSRPQDEYILRPEKITRWDYSGRTRVHNENHNNRDRSRTDPPGNSRNVHVKQRDDRMRKTQGEIRPENEIPPPAAYHGNRRQRPIHNERKEYSHTDRMRQDGHQFRHENGSSQALPNNSQVGSNNSSQKLSAIATEFIPLQALTRSRQRKAAPASSTLKTVQNPNWKSRVQQDEAAALPTSVQSTVERQAERPSSSYRPRRKTKIAAKFDADWDL